MNGLVEALEGKDLFEILTFAAEAYNDSTAVTDRGGDGAWRDHSYRALFDDAETLAGILQDRYAPGTHIALCAGNSYRWILTFFGIVCSGNIAVLLDREMTDSELENALRLTDAQLLVTDRPLPAGGVPGFGLDEFPGDPGPAAGRLVHRHDDLSPAIFLMTSGVTSSPKCVVLSQANLIYSTLCGLDAVPLERGLSTLSVLPPHHSFELCTGILYHIMSGSRIIVNDRKENFIKNLYAFRPDCLVTVPTVVLALLSLLKADLANHRDSAVSGLKYIYCGGAAISPAIIDEMKAHGVLVLQGYGMTECSPGITFNHLDDVTSDTVGTPMKYVSLRLEQGEILVKGPNVMLGYYKNEAATRQVLRDGWLRTGDVGRLDEKGRLILCGRVRNVIVLSSGENVYPEELEEKVLFADPAVKYCRVYEENGMIAAEVFAPQLDREAIQAVVDRVNGEVSKFKRIRRLAVLPELPPVTALGKAIRRDP